MYTSKFQVPHPVLTCFLVCFFSLVPRSFAPSFYSSVPRLAITRCIPSQIDSTEEEQGSGVKSTSSPSTKSNLLPRRTSLGPCHRRREADRVFWNPEAHLDLELHLRLFFRESMLRRCALSELRMNDIHEDCVLLSVPLDVAREERCKRSSSREEGGSWRSWEVARCRSRAVTDSALSLAIISFLLHNI